MKKIKKKEDEQKKNQDVNKVIPNQNTQQHSIGNLNKQEEQKASSKDVKLTEQQQVERTSSKDMKPGEKKTESKPVEQKQASSKDVKLVEKKTEVKPVEQKQSSSKDDKPEEKKIEVKSIEQKQTSSNDVKPEEKKAEGKPVEQKQEERTSSKDIKSEEKKAEFKPLEQKQASSKDIKPEEKKAEVKPVEQKQEEKKVYFRPPTETTQENKNQTSKEIKKTDQNQVDKNQSSQEVKLKEQNQEVKNQPPQDVKRDEKPVENKTLSTMEVIETEIKHKDHHEENKPTSKFLSQHTQEINKEQKITPSVKDSISKPQDTNAIATKEEKQNVPQSTERENSISLKNDNQPSQMNTQTGNDKAPSKILEKEVSFNQQAKLSKNYDDDKLIEKNRYQC